MRTLTWEGLEFGNFILITTIICEIILLKTCYVVVSFRVWFRNLANASNNF